MFNKSHFCKIFLGLETSKASNKAWLYDFETQTFEEVGSLHMKRIDHTCAPLRLENSNQIACTGGYSDSINVESGSPDLRFVEIFDQINRNWILTSHSVPALG